MLRAQTVDADTQDVDILIAQGSALERKRPLGEEEKKYSRLYCC